MLKLISVQMIKIILHVYVCLRVSDICRNEVNEIKSKKVQSYKNFNLYFYIG